MDTIKIATTLVMALVLGVNQPETDTDANNSPSVQSWPVSDIVSEVIPAPKPDPVPDEPPAAVADAGMKSYLPGPEPKTSGKQWTESEIRAIAASEYQAQKQVDLQTSQRHSSGGSNGGSSGGRVVQQPQAVIPAAVYAPMSSVVYETPTVTKSATSTRTYRAINGCTIRETTWSDGTKTRETISCPLNRLRRRS